MNFKFTLSEAKRPVIATVGVNCRQILRRLAAQDKLE